MLREPRLSTATPEAGHGGKQSRFKIVKLEERIAPKRGKNHGNGPKCHENGQGTLVGCGKPS